MSDIKQEDILNYILTHAVGNGSYYNTDLNSIAKKIMVELVKTGYADFILLRDDEVNKWWTKLVERATDAFEAHREKMQLYEIKLAGYEKLSEADRKILGVRKPVKPKPLRM